METVEYPCDKCGHSFSDSTAFVSHPCSKRQIAAPGKGQGYKCSQCNEVFSKLVALRCHFKTNHSSYEHKGPFACSEHNCQFKSSDRQVYQAHLISVHGLDLIPCTYRSCKMSFHTQGEMETHWRSHMPFGCFHCDFVTQNTKDLIGHLLEHNHLPNNCQGKHAMAEFLRYKKRIVISYYIQTVYVEEQDFMSILYYS